MTFDNSNRKNIREAEKSAKLAEANRIAYTKTIMSDLFGRAWMHDLLTRCSIFHSPFVAGAPDITSFRCGAQNLGLELFGDVATHCPHEYTLMMTEASIKDEANGRRYESGNDTDQSTSAGRNGHPTESSSYTTDNDGFVTDNSGPIESGGEGSEGHLHDLEPRWQN